MDENMSQQSNEKSLMKENLQYHRESTTKLARTVPTWGIETRVKCVGNTFVFCFGFYFMGPKWTRTKIVIVISPSLQGF